MEMKRFANDNEGDKNKKKIIAIKTTNIKDMESDDEDCQSEINKYMKLMFKKFKESLRHTQKIQVSNCKMKKYPLSFPHATNAESKGI